MAVSPSGTSTGPRPGSRSTFSPRLSYEQKFGVSCPPHTSTEAAIDTFEATAACLGVRRGPSGRWRIYAPYGLADVFNLVVRPNPPLAPRHVYRPRPPVGASSGRA